MVEAAGIEPASEKVRTEASTRLADWWFISPVPSSVANLVPASPFVSIRRYGRTAGIQLHAPGQRGVVLPVRPVMALQLDQAVLGHRLQAGNAQMSGLQVDAAAIAEHEARRTVGQIAREARAADRHAAAIGYGAQLVLLLQLVAALHPTFMALETAAEHGVKVMASVVTAPAWAREPGVNVADAGAGQGSISMSPS